MSSQRIAIVTGGSRGIGAGISLALASKGIDIALVYTSNSSTPQAEEVKKQIVAFGRKAISIQADLSKPDCGKIVIAAALKSFSVEKVDILVNNAGINGAAGLCDSLNVDIDDFTKIININTLAPMLLVKSIVPHMNRGGRIISISSVLAHAPYPGYDAYAASKAAIEALTRQWAITLGKSHGITANSIICGSVVTDMMAHVPDEILEPIRASAAAEHRLGTTDDIAQVVAMLADDGARWVTGQTIGVHGGVFFN